MAQPLSFGVRGGVPFTGPFADAAGTVGVQTSSGSNAYAVGPMIELHLPLGFSVEADALYHPLHMIQQINTGTILARNPYTYMSWEFPILAKYRFLHLPLVKPYVEAGPSFRAVSSSLSYFSKSGLTVGAGVELKLSRLRIEPELRYTRWRSDMVLTEGEAAGLVVVSTVPSNTNQAQFLVGIAF